jgi:hypothetical protein
VQKQCLRKSKGLPQQIEREIKKQRAKIKSEGRALRIENGQLTIDSCGKLIIDSWQLGKTAFSQLEIICRQLTTECLLISFSKSETHNSKLFLVDR